MRRTISYEPNLCIALEGIWLFVNDKRFGFLNGDGIYCHRKAPEVYNKEYGFHVPRFFLHKVITWECQIKEKVVTWMYDPKDKQRFLATNPLVFISLARLKWIPDAKHIARPFNKPPKPKDRNR